MKFIDQLDDKTKIRLGYVLLIGCTIGVFILGFFLDNYDLSYGVFFAVQPVFGICICISLKLFKVTGSLMYEKPEDFEMSLIDIIDYNDLKAKLFDQLIRFGKENCCDFSEIQSIILDDESETCFAVGKSDITGDCFGFQLIKTKKYDSKIISKAVINSWKVGSEKAGLEEDRNRYLANILFLIVDEEDANLHYFVNTFSEYKVYLMNYQRPYYVRALRCGIAMSSKKGYVYLFGPKEDLDSREKMIKELFFNVTYGIMNTRKLKERLASDNGKKWA